MAPEIALDAIPERDGDALTVLDPMCGSGTVLSAALERGHNAVGVDIDPLAVMMSRLTVSPVDGEGLSDARKSVIASAKRTGHSPPWGDDAETNRFVNYWFGEKQKKDLVALASSVAAVESDINRLALQLAISRIIVTKSPQASLAADAAHSRPHKVIQTSSYDVFGGFDRSVSQLTRMLAGRRRLGDATVLLGDARALEPIGDGAADLAVTSPPYLNALDYLRGHKLALVWFGYTVSELRRRRSVSIGAERGPDSASTGAVAEIVELVEQRVKDKTRLRRGMLERFAQDCAGFSSELNRTIKPGGSAVLVVGNSTLRGNYIRNDLVTQKAMELAGFTLVERYERDIPPTRRYMAIGAEDDESSITKRMRREVVLTMRRADR